MYAVMSGHTHIASYLLSLGSNANIADSSGTYTDGYCFLP